MASISICQLNTVVNVFSKKKNRKTGLEVGGWKEKVTACVDLFRPLACLAFCLHCQWLFGLVNNNKVRNCSCCCCLAVHKYAKNVNIA